LVRVEILVSCCQITSVSNSQRLVKASLGFFATQGRMLYLYLSFRPQLMQNSSVDGFWAIQFAQRVDDGVDPGFEMDFGLRPFKASAMIITRTTSAPMMIRPFC